MEPQVVPHPHITTVSVCLQLCGAASLTSCVKRVESSTRRLKGHHISWAGRKFPQLQPMSCGMDRMAEESREEPRLLTNDCQCLPPCPDWRWLCLQISLGLRCPRTKRAKRICDHQQVQSLPFSDVETMTQTREEIRPRSHRKLMAENRQTHGTALAWSLLFLFHSLFPALPCI